MELSDIITIITVLSSSGIIGWFLGKRKNNAEITEISTRVYNTLIKDLREEIADLRATSIEQEKNIKRRDEEFDKWMIYVEKLEELLIESNVIKRADLEKIKVNLGI